MKQGIYGFSRKEVIWFSLFFIASFTIIVVSVTRLIHKYYSHHDTTYAEIKKHSHDLWNLQEITLFATNIQRSSLNMIIYANDPKELQTVSENIKKYRDSLTLEFIRIAQEDHLDKALQKNLEMAGKKYLAVNNIFKKIVSDSIKKESAAQYNINTMRPALRTLTDASRKTGQLVTSEIQRSIETRINIFLQIEFWLLALALLPYFYFFIRFLYLVVKMIIWDISLKQ